MMMILVVLRLQRLLMEKMVKPKQYLLLFLGLPFLQELFLGNLFMSSWNLLCDFHVGLEQCHLHCELPSRVCGRSALTLPLMPMWSKVSGVHLSAASPDLVLGHEHASPPTSCLSSDTLLSSPENTHSDTSIDSQPVPQAQQSTHTHLDISLFPLALTHETNNGTLALVDESDDLGTNVSNTELQEKISSLEIKLKVSEEEKQRIQKDVELLMEKHSILEKDFLKEKEQEAISFQDRYKELQEKHKQELEDMRKAGHEALSIIVDEYKGLLQSSVKQQVESIEKQYISAIEKQARRCEELLNAQEILEKCLEEERQKNKETLESAAKLEQDAVKDIVMKAVEEERKNLEKVHAEERELWKTEHARDQEKVSQAIQTALQEQRKISQETVEAAIREEQKRSAKAVEEAVRRTREELIEYVKEQKRLDQVIRQRSLSSLELFLSCAQKQLSALIATEPSDIE
ncbi:coiled-coil domain-containing protein 91 isoform X3 [Dipodomys spectabilis]|uniref:coiled-coil domain-containing protein 91 isoform X3 n=1 Tax=Dipodomys spectabilis TaxID=105255 RepID=UPI001C53DF8F|nr:coiled-coil domain-containing protein 91 isoform X3 [Dipodomys spectabilis]